MYAYAGGCLDEEDLFLLEELGDRERRWKPEVPYYTYDPFDFESITSDESYINFRFWKEDIPRVMAGLRIPDMITTYNRVNVSGTEAFCLLLRRLAYPCRLSDIAKEFFGQRPIPVLSVVVKHMLDYLHDNFASRLLTTLDQPWLSSHRLQQFAGSIHARGAALANCWAFMDGTVRHISRPSQFQEECYNSHKRVHALKY